VLVGADDQHWPSKGVQLVMYKRLARGKLRFHVVKRYVVGPAGKVQEIELGRYM
jgi:hypothetical protein